MTLRHPYLLAATEVTVKQFAKFVEATEYVTDGERFNGRGLRKTTSKRAAARNWTGGIRGTKRTTICQ